MSNRPIDNQEDKILIQLIEKFARLEGRQPRVMITAKNSAESSNQISQLTVELANLGFDVDMAPHFNLVTSMVKNAVENDVDVLLISDEMRQDQNDFFAKVSHSLTVYNRSDMMIILHNSEINDMYSSVFSQERGAIFRSQKSLSEILKNFLKAYLE